MTVHPGRLLLVPTPLDFGVTASNGPPPDLREVLPAEALRTASRLRHWVAENAKTTRAFLKRVDAIEPLQHSLQSIEIRELPRPHKGSADRPRDEPWPALLAPALAGNELGLVCEAGMPAVADPGAGLVQAAHAARVPVVALAGPSALMLALASSGLNGQSFAFVGYLPVESAARQARIRELEGWSRRAAQTQLMIETPYRNAALLGALLSTLQPATRLSVSCGLTLAGGWTRSAPVADWRAEAFMHMPADVPAVFALLAT